MSTIAGTASNQIYNRGVEWSLRPQTFYSDQIIRQNLVMAPVGGNGTAGDQFTIQLTFRKMGNVVEVNGITTSNPTSPTAVPTYVHYQSLTTLDARFIPAVTKTLVAVGGYNIGPTGYFDFYTISFVSTGYVTMDNLPSGSAFPFKAILGQVNGYYPLISGDL